MEKYFGNSRIRKIAKGVYNDIGNLRIRNITNWKSQLLGILELSAMLAMPLTRL
jgi:hypothetical protein